MIYFFNSAMTGAPTLAGQVGKMIEVLDACLVNGWGTATVDSLSVTSNVATVTRAAGHPFQADMVVEISGATPAGLNGKKKVIATTSTTYTFDATGIANGAATGTIQHKVAPVGWAKQYSGTNLAAYKATDPAATGCLLRVDDTGTTSARVVGYLTMSDVNTGTGPFPTAAQVSGGGFWGKSQVADASARTWSLYADERMFIISLDWSNVGSQCKQSFGDFRSAKSPDPFACQITCGNGSQTGSSPGGSAGWEGDYAQAGGYYQNTPAQTWLARGVSGLGSSIQAFRGFATIGHNAAGYYQSGQTTNLPIFPSPADNGLYLSEIFYNETSPVACYRGSFPGLWFVPQGIAATFVNYERVTGVSNLPGRTLMALRNSSGASFVDLTGPWR